MFLNVLRYPIRIHPGDWQEVFRRVGRDRDSLREHGRDLGVVGMVTVVFLMPPFSLEVGRFLVETMPIIYDTL